MAEAPATFEKELSSLEIRIPVRYRDKFRGESIMIRFGKREIPMKMDDHGRMNPSFLLWNRFTSDIGFDPNHDILAFEISSSGIGVTVRRSPRG